MGKGDDVHCTDANAAVTGPARGHTHLIDGKAGLDVPSSDTCTGSFPLALT